MKETTRTPALEPSRQAKPEPTASGKLFAWHEEPLSEPEARACIRWLTDELAAEAAALLLGVPEALAPEAFFEPCLEEEPDVLVIIEIARVALEVRHD